MDTTKYETQQFYRYIKEGRYRKNEFNNFDHEVDSAQVLNLTKETKMLERKVDFRILTMYRTWSVVLLPESGGLVQI